MNQNEPDDPTTALSPSSIETSWIAYKIQFLYLSKFVLKITKKNYQKKKIFLNWTN